MSRSKLALIGAMLLSGFVLYPQGAFGVKICTLAFIGAPEDALVDGWIPHKNRIRKIRISPREA